MEISLSDGVRCFGYLGMATADSLRVSVVSVSITPLESCHFLLSIFTKLLKTSVSVGFEPWLISECASGDFAGRGR